MTLRPFLFFILTFTILFEGYSQPYSFRHYQVEDGLSHNSVSCSIQDSNGFMWFGTKDGLNRFDGYSFKIYRHQENDSTSIGCNFIRSLFEDQGKLWVGTDEGLFTFNPETEKFHFFNAKINENTKDITKDLNGNIWFISGYALCKYNPSTEQLTILDPNRFFYASSLCTSNDGTIWASSRDGLLKKYDHKNHYFTNYDVFAHSPETDTHWIEKIKYTSENTILIGTQSQGIKLFDVLTESYQDILSQDEDHSSLFVRDFIQSSADEYWVATESGIYMYHAPKNYFTHLKKSYNNPYSLSDNAVYTLCKDNEGGIWAGTYFGGLNYYPKQYTPFEKFFPKVAQNSINGNAVREICPDKEGMIWIGTEDAGLNKYNPTTGVFTNYMPNGTSESLSHYNIHGLLAINNELWIGTFHHGLDIMDIHTGKVIRHYSANSPDTGLKSNFIYTILQTSEGDILVGTSYGLYKYVPKHDNFEAIPAYSGADEYTVTLLEDHNGIIWAGTYNNGIYYIDPKSQKRGFFKNDPKDSTSLISNFINHIYEDSNEHLWFTTNSGLCQLNREDTTFTSFTTKNGLPSNVVYRIEEDNDGILWISTSKGLAQYDPLEKTFKTYTTANGLLSDQFNYSSSYYNGQYMYFGSVKGLIRFNPKAFITNDYVPPVHITGFQVNNKELKVGQKQSPLQKSIIHTHTIKLNHNQSSFSIDFAALSFTAPEMTEYRFKMDGLSSDWTYLQTNRKVYFTELSAGHYTFKVAAANSSGIWSKENTTLHIVILPPWWASTWAYTLYVVLSVLAFAAAFTLYHQQTVRKNLEKISALENEKEKEIYQAKIEFFTNVAHEIRTPLTLITGPLEKALRLSAAQSAINKSLVVMQKNTSRLLELTNELLDFRKAETQQFSLTFVQCDIKLLLKEIMDRFNPLIEEKQLDANINLPDTDSFAYVDAEALTKIISNLLSNAIKFARKKLNIRLTFFNRGSDRLFNLIISNDGPLIPEDLKEKIFEPFFRIHENHEQKGTGIGLPLARSLAELHNGELSIDLQKSELNTFILTLPVRQEKEFKLFEDLDHKSTTPEEHTISKEEDASKPTILIVEDNPDMMDFISSELISEYMLYKAGNGQEALNILDSKIVHIVISDVMMPIMDGMELCKEIKSKVDYSHLPVILLTAKNGLQSKIEGLESGADVYIEKPFSVAHLKVQIATLLANKEKIRQYYISNPLSHIKSMGHTSSDEIFLEKLNDVIYQHIEDSELNVDVLANEMNMSKPTLYRKIKTVSKMTPNELINLARLKKAAELLVTDRYKIYEVAQKVGYNSQTSFGRNFHKQFGMTPSEFMLNKDFTSKG